MALRILVQCVVLVATFATSTSAQGLSDAERSQIDGAAKAALDATIDRSLFTPSANAFFTADVLKDYAASLALLGVPTEFTAGGDSLRGGMTIRSFRIRAGGVLLDVSMMVLPDGKIDQFIVSRAG